MSDDKEDIHTSIMKMKAPTETTKLKSALLDKAVEGNPVMASCLKCKKGIGLHLVLILKFKGNG
jgi:hypothetical protein